MAVGTVTVTWPNDMRGENRMKVVKFACIGGTDAQTGTIPDTDFNTVGEVTGWYLYSVKTYKVGTAPEAAHVFILDANDLDLLGSVDGGTTAYNGLNLIDASLTKMNIPSFYDTRAGTNVNFYPMITGTLTLKVSGQATASASWAIECTFIR